MLDGKKYEFGNRLLQSALLSNIVYPVRTQGQYIRHFTPGKNWNSLYTWDSGFIALGLIDIDIAKAFECIRAYTTPVGSESAFIHHDQCYWKMHQHRMKMACIKHNFKILKMNRNNYLFEKQHCRS